MPNMASEVAEIGGGEAILGVPKGGGEQISPPPPQDVIEIFLSLKTLKVPIYNFQHLMFSFIDCMTFDNQCRTYEHSFFN